VMERARSVLEELEGFERCVQDSLLRKRRRSGGRLSRLHADFAISKLLDAAENVVRGEGGELSEASSNELALRIDAEKVRIEAECKQGFYAEKRRLHEYYAKHPDAAGHMEVLQVCRSRCEERPKWSGEERHGKYLDLHELHQTFINLKNVPQVNYMDYLRCLGNFSDLQPAKVKGNKAYLAYLKNLFEYLHGFHERTQALVPLDFDTLEKNFETNWAKGTVPGWERRDDISGETKLEELLEKCGTEGLAKELAVRGAKSGGSPQQRAERLHLILKQKQGISDPEKEEARGALKKTRLMNAKATANAEAKVSFMVEHLGDFVDATKSFITRKQTQTYDELVQEEEAEARREAGEDDDDDALYEDEYEDNAVMDNPLNLPLDADGQPIPLWMYKLHGLRVEYNCEICGNYTYRGRHAYEKHFREWRHAHGMRVLGIPNSEHFTDIASIDEAKALHAKLQESLKEKVFDRDSGEQFEDSQGNVLDRKTYMDLKKQGLL